MEKLMQYVWQHRLWNPAQMTTVDGRSVKILDPGLLNTDAGPDFFNAKIEIGGRLWAGNVEMHVRASDWARHHHDRDRAYDSVILHVVEKDDAPVRRGNGEIIPQMVMRCSPQFHERYARLTEAKTQLPCAAQIAEIPQLTITEWVQRLAFERLQSKVERILDLYSLTSGNWEEICYITLARNLGFGINNDAFEMLARRTPLRLLHKHSDSALQVEALLFGQAGMLADPGPEATVPYYRQLRREYAFLANKFQLKPMDGSMWKTFRIRPQNFPYRRVALLAHFVTGGFSLMTEILERRSEAELRELFTVRLDGFWESHHTFAGAATANAAALSDASIDIILINTVAPLYYAYSVKSDSYEHSERAVSLLEALRPERNSIVAAFTAAGIKCPDALTSQALIQLRREYCQPRKCLYCKIGHRLLSAAACGRE